MFQVEKEGAGLRVEMSSQFENVDRAVAEIQPFVENEGLLFDDDAQVVVREMCNNGIEHGNKKMITKSICVEIGIDKSRHLQIAVTDQGDGFDLGSVNLSAADNADDERSNGLPWIHAMADSLVTEQGGRKVIAVLLLKKKVQQSTTQVKLMSSLVEIQLPENVVASQVKEIHTQFLDVIDRKLQSFIIICHKVDIVDSAGLSLMLAFFKGVRKDNPKSVITMVGVRDPLLKLMRMSHVEKAFGVEIKEDGA